MAAPALTSYDRVLDGLSSAQLEAVTHGTGPLLIVAGAGTGKTTVLTRRIAHLITSKQARPEEILALTFTDKAAREMAERVDQLIPYGYAETWIGTFHAFGDSVLREGAMEAGLNPEFRVLTRPEQIIFLRERLWKLPLDRFRPLGDPTRNLEALLTLVSRAKDEDASALAGVPRALPALQRAQRLTHRRHLIDGRRRAIQLTSAMIGNHDPIRAGRHRLARIVRIKHALENERPLPKPAHPLEILPRHAGVKRRRRPRQQSAERIGALHHAAQIAEREGPPHDAHVVDPMRMRREIPSQAQLRKHGQIAAHPVADIAIARTQDGQIDSKDKSPAVGRRRARNDLAHFLFDGREVLRRERLVAEKIIEEAVFNHRANGHLRSRKKFLHGFRQNVSAVVANELKRPVILARDDLQRSICSDGIMEINQRAVDDCHHRLFLQ